MKQIDRRKFLFGAGGSIIALPWLEMNAEDAVTKKFKDPSLRFASFYSPMGFVRDHFLEKHYSIVWGKKEKKQNKTIKQ